MTQRVFCVMVGMGLAVAIAAAQEKKTPPAGEKAAAKAGEKTSAEKAAGDKAAAGKADAEKAGDAKPAPKVHEKVTQFKKLHQELRDAIERLGKIQEEYRLVKREGRPALEEEFDVRKARAKQLMPQVTQAAKEAIVAEPADPDVMDYLGALAHQAFQKRGAYEEAVELAALILDQQKSWEKFRRPELFRIGGVSAFRAANLDTAEKYLKELEKYPSEDFTPAPEYRANVKQEREYWGEELERRKKEEQAAADPVKALPRVTLKTTQGDLVVELFENEAPNTVANFITLVEKKFYDGRRLASSPSEVRAGQKSFHEEDKQLDYTIACEGDRKDFRRHFRGSLAMSIPFGKDTGCSEIIICLEPIHERDSKVVEKEIVGGATVFGRVVSGMDVLSKVRHAVQTSTLSEPSEKIVEATVLRKRKHAYEVKKVDKKAKTEEAVKPSAEPKTPEETEDAKTSGKTEAGKTGP